MYLKYLIKKTQWKNNMTIDNSYFWGRDEVNFKSDIIYKLENT